MKCPGQDTRYWKPGAIFEVACPGCGHLVEFFQDDTTRPCGRCGRKVVNPKVDFGCASYCPYAEKCLSELPPGLAQERRKASGGKTDIGESDMKMKRKIIQIDEALCDGCAQCVPSCAEGAIEIVDGKARLVADRYCDGLGACLGECPTGALSVIEREAEAFDEAAVEDLLKTREKQEAQQEGALPCGCPSAQIQTFFTPLPSAAVSSRPGATDASALSHWPVQIGLVPAKAPFLKAAHLLVAADCAPVAYPHFHRDFLPGKVVLVGCPKFDDVQDYVRRFTEIFRQADIRSVTVLVMEVPCCQGLPGIVEKGMKLAGKQVPLEKVVVSARGQVLAREVLAA